MFFDLLAEIRNQEHDAPNSKRAQQLELMLKKWLAAHFNHRLGNRFGKRAHPFPKPASKNHSLHVKFARHDQAVEDNSRKGTEFVGEASLDPSPTSAPRFR